MPNAAALRVVCSIPYTDILSFMCVDGWRQARGLHGDLAMGIGAGNNIQGDKTLWKTVQNNESVIHQSDESMWQVGGGDKGWCSPFKGLFESIKQELEAGCILTTSMQVCAALSSLPHRRVLAELP